MNRTETRIVTCPYCEGTGRIVARNCTGKVIGTSCDKCDGSGGFLVGCAEDLRTVTRIGKAVREAFERCEDDYRFYTEEAAQAIANGHTAESVAREIASAQEWMRKYGAELVKWRKVYTAVKGA